MTKSLLSYDQEDALCRILRHHAAPVTRKLVEDLSVLINWIRDQDEAEVHRFAKRPLPPPLITVLSGLGIYGAEYVDKVSVQPGKAPQ